MPKTNYTEFGIDDQTGEHWALNGDTNEWEVVHPSVHRYAKMAKSQPAPKVSLKDRALNTVKNVQTGFSKKLQPNPADGPRTAGIREGVKTTVDSAKAMADSINTGAKYGGVLGVGAVMAKGMYDMGRESLRKSDEAWNDTSEMADETFLGIPQRAWAAGGHAALAPLSIVGVPAIADMLGRATSDIGNNSPEAVKNRWAAGTEIGINAIPAAAIKGLKVGRAASGPVGRAAQRKAARMQLRASGVDNVQDLKKMMAVEQGVPTGSVATVLDEGGAPAVRQEGYYNALERKANERGKMVTDKEALINRGDLPIPLDEVEARMEGRVVQHAQVDPANPAVPMRRTVKRKVEQIDPKTGKKTKVTVEEPGPLQGRTDIDTREIDNLNNRMADIRTADPHGTGQVDFHDLVPRRRTWDRAAYDYRDANNRVLPEGSPAHSQKVAADVLRDVINEYTPDIAKDRNSFHAFNDLKDELGLKLSAAAKRSLFDVPDTVWKAFITRHLITAGASALGAPILMAGATVEAVRGILTSTLLRTAGAPALWKFGKFLAAGDFDNAARLLQVSTDATRGGAGGTSNTANPGRGTGPGGGSGGGLPSGGNTGGGPVVVPSRTANGVPAGYDPQTGKYLPSLLSEEAIHEAAAQLASFRFTPGGGLMTRSPEGNPQMLFSLRDVEPAVPQRKLLPPHPDDRTVGSGIPMPPSSYYESPQAYINPESVGQLPQLNGPRLSQLEGPQQPSGAQYGIDPFAAGQQLPTSGPAISGLPSRNQPKQLPPHNDPPPPSWEPDGHYLPPLDSPSVDRVGMLGQLLNSPANKKLRTSPLRNVVNPDSPDTPPAATAAPVKPPKPGPKSPAGAAAKNTQATTAAAKSTTDSTTAPSGKGSSNSVVPERKPAHAAAQEERPQWAEDRINANKQKQQELNEISANTKGEDLRTPLADLMARKKTEEAAAAAAKKKETAAGVRKAASDAKKKGSAKPQPVDGGLADLTQAGKETARFVQKQVDAVKAQRDPRTVPPTQPSLDSQNGTISQPDPSQFKGPRPVTPAAPLDAKLPKSAEKLSIPQLRERAVQFMNAAKAERAKGNLTNAGRAQRRAEAYIAEANRLDAMARENAGLPPKSDKQKMTVESLPSGTPAVKKQNATLPSDKKVTPIPDVRKKAVPARPADTTAPPAASAPTSGPINPETYSWLGNAGDHVTGTYKLTGASGSSSASARNKFKEFEVSGKITGRGVSKDGKPIYFVATPEGSRILFEENISNVQRKTADQVPAVPPKEAVTDVKRKQ